MAAIGQARGEPKLTADSGDGID